MISVIELYHHQVHVTGVPLALFFMRRLRGDGPSAQLGAKAHFVAGGAAVGAWAWGSGWGAAVTVTMRPRNGS